MFSDCERFNYVLNLTYFENLHDIFHCGHHLLIISSPNRARGDKHTHINIFKPNQSATRSITRPTFRS